MSEFRLTWRKTWPDKENDFVGRAPGVRQTIGRIMLGPGGRWAQHDQWSWFYQAMLPDLPWAELKRGGTEETARAAAMRIEETWSQAIAGTHYETANLDG